MESLANYFMQRLDWAGVPVRFSMELLEPYSVATASYSALSPSCLLEFNITLSPPTPKPRNAEVYEEKITFTQDNGPTIVYTIKHGLARLKWTDDNEVKIRNLFFDRDPKKVIDEFVAVLMNDRNKKINTPENIEQAWL